MADRYETYTPAKGSGRAGDMTAEANKKGLKLFLKFILLAAAVALIIFLFQHFNLYVYLTNKEKGIQFVNSFGPLSIFVFILLQILQVLVAPIPGEATGFIGGYLYGALMGTVYSTIGLTIGSWLAFMLSKIFGMPFVEKFVKAETLKKYDHFIEHSGTYITFILFLIPGFPKDTFCYILGISHMKIGVFMVISTVGRLLGTIFLSVGGACVRNDQRIAFIILLIAGGLIFLWGFFHSRMLLRRFKKHESE
jgi:uncharacterized membrane protein YdjX (TVP38/TMEM64 family)